MQACQRWDAIEYGDLPYHDDQRALEAIIAGVPPEMGVLLANKESAKEAWDSIAAARIGVDHVRRATLQRLRKEWENLAFHPSEQAEDFALRLSAPPLGEGLSSASTRVWRRSAPHGGG
jgi:hypothetical protein